MPTIFVEDQPTVQRVGDLVHVRNVNHHSVWPIDLFNAFLEDGTRETRQARSCTIHTLCAACEKRPMQLTPLGIDS